MMPGSMVASSGLAGPPGTPSRSTGHQPRRNRSSKTLMPVWWLSLLASRWRGPLFSPEELNRPVSPELQELRRAIDKTLKPWPGPRGWKNAPRGWPGWDEHIEKLTRELQESLKQK